jgi:universal stress protein A
MIRRILIAVNENRSSQFAMQVGVAMAAASRAQVRLVHVVFPSLLREWGLGDETPQTEALITAGEALLAGFRQSLPQDVTADTRLRQGRPADEIIAAAREWNADLIVIGDHRPRSLSTFALGNTSDAVVRHAPCPIVVARKTEWPPAPATLPNATCSTSPNGVDDA